MKRAIAFALVWLASLFMGCCKPCPPPAPPPPPPPVVLKVQEPCLTEPPPVERTGEVLEAPACAKGTGLVACMDAKTLMAITYNIAHLRSYAEEAWKRCGTLSANKVPTPAAAAAAPK